MTRRSLLAALPALAAAPARLEAAAGLRVIVVGAGLAGLACARDLAAAGAEVQVLEARDRIGGRIWTSRAWPDLPVDLGASWIHGIRGNPLSALADRAGAARLKTSYDRATAFDAMGETTDLSAAYGHAEAVIAAARAEAERGGSDISLQAAVEASRGWAEADAPTRRLIRHVVNGSVEAEYAGGWSEVSAWHFDDSGAFGGGDVLFPDGFDRITTFLSRGLEIRTGAPVAAIAPEGGGVAVTLRDGTRLTAGKLVLTVPLGVLKAGDIGFGAPLDPAREAAIGALGMGLLNKCWLRFDRIAWPDDVDWIEWVGPQDGAWAQWLSLARAAGLPVLLGFHAAGFARGLEALDDRATAAAAHAALKTIFGSGLPAPVAAQVTRWSADPFSHGSYSFNATGSTPSSRRALAGADWQGRLIFAGEAASPDHWGTAHGALFSGQQAARQAAG